MKPCFLLKGKKGEKNERWTKKRYLESDSNDSAKEILSIFSPKLFRSKNWIAFSEMKWEDILMETPSSNNFNISIFFFICVAT